jgi:tetratricopeptide (TPR) repeat protein
MPRILAYKPEIAFQIFKYILPALVFLFAILGKMMDKKDRADQEIQMEEIPNQESTELPTTVPESKNGIRRIIYLFNIALVILLSILTLKHTRKPVMKNIMLTDYYTYTQQWDKAINTAISEPVYNVFINFNFNRAIDQKGVFLDKFFEYPQVLGSAILLPNKATGADVALVSSDYYYDLGYMSESLHWAHEAQTLLPYSPRILKRIVIANLVFGNYRTAEKYLRVLNDNFLSRKFVNKYTPYIQDTTLIRNDQELMLKREFLPRGYIADIEKNFQQLLEQNPNNKRAFEHMQMCYLLDHDLPKFLAHMNAGKKFYSGHTPSLFEEGLMVYLLETDRTKLSKMDLDPRNKSILLNYTRIMNQFKNNTTRARAELKKYIGDTYIYYLIYYAPRKK